MRFKVLMKRLFVLCLVFTIILPPNIVHAENSAMDQLLGVDTDSDQPEISLPEIPVSLEPRADGMVPIESSIGTPIETPTEATPSVTTPTETSQEGSAPSDSVQVELPNQSVSNGSTTEDLSGSDANQPTDDKSSTSEEVNDVLGKNGIELYSYEIVVKVKSTDTIFDTNSLIGESEGVEILNANTIRQNGKYYLISVESKNTLTEVMNLIRQSSMVSYVEENKQISVSSTVSTNDEYSSQQWALENIALTSDTAQVINNLPSDRTVIVAVIDTGVDVTHPDLAGRVLPGKNVISVNPTGITYTEDNTMDDYGHGTMVSGIIAAQSNNGIGISGATLNSNVMILPIKALNNSGRGSSFDIADAIEYAADSNAAIINMSLGDTEYSGILQEAINYAQNKGVLIVASSGNESSSVDEFYPASFPGVIAVGAIDSKNTVASFSNQGQSLDLVAPGLSIISTTSKMNRITGSDLGDEVKGYYSVQNGTSFSAPYVSAGAALYKLKHPDITAGELAERLLSSAKDLKIVGFDTATGYGKLDLKALLNDTNQATNKITFLEPATNQYLSKSITIRAQIISDVDVSNVSFYMKKIADENLISTVTSIPGSDIYEGVGDISKYSNGTYQLIAVAYGLDGKVVLSSELTIKIVQNSSTGLLLTIKNPAGELAANAKIMAYQKIKTYYTDTSEVKESYQLVWQGKSTSDGIVRISNTEIADLSELYLVVQGNFDYKDSMNGKAFYMYNRVVSTPGEYEVLGNETVAVTLNAKGKDNQGLKNVKYYLAVLNGNSEIAGATSELNDTGSTAPTVFLDRGNYNLFAYSEEDDGATYLLSKWKETITAESDTLNFDPSDVGEVRLDLSNDTKVSDGVIYLYNDTTQACLGIKNQQVYGRKLFVGSGSYHYKVQAQVNESSDSWIYEFDGIDNTIDVEQGKVNLISVGKSIRLDTFTIDRMRQENYLAGQGITYNDNSIKESLDGNGISNFTVPTNYKNIYIEEQFLDAYNNKLTKLSKGTLNTSSIQEYTTAVATTTVNPYLKITDPAGNVLYNKAFAVFYDYSFWYLGNSSILGNHIVEMSLVSNPLAPEGLNAKMIHSLYAEKMHVLKLNVKGVGVVQPFVWIYSLNDSKEDLQWKQVYSLWSSGLAATFGEIRLDNSLQLSKMKNGNMLVLYYFTDKAKTKPVVITRNFTDISDLGNENGIIEVVPDNYVWTVIDPIDSHNQKMESVRSYRNLVLPVETEDKKIVYLDHPLTQTYFNGCYLEPGNYYFSGEFTSLIQNGAYSNYYLLSDRTEIAKGSSAGSICQVSLSSVDSKKLSLTVDHDKYYDYRGSSISYSAEYNNIHSNLVLQGNNYYTMGDEFYFPVDYKMKDLKFILALGDREDSNKIWNYVIDRGDIADASKDQTIAVGGDISTKVVLTQASFTSKDKLSGKSFVTDAYGNSVSSIYINSNANWLTKGLSTPEVSTSGILAVNESMYSVSSEGTVSVVYMVPTIEIYRKDNGKPVFSSKNISYMKGFELSLSNFAPGNYELYYKLPTGPNGVVTSSASFTVGDANSNSGGNSGNGGSSNGGNSDNQNDSNQNTNEQNQNNQDKENENGNSNTIKKYTVTINLKNGSNYTALTVPNGDYLKEPVKPKRVGYTFVGWYRGSEKYSFTKPVDKSFMLSAKWKANKYIIMFRANGGTVSVSSKEVTYRGKYRVLPVPVREGYEFTGWYTKKAGGKRITSVTKVTIARNQTLYAHWLKKN